MKKRSEPRALYGVFNTVSHVVYIRQTKRRAEETADRVKATIKDLGAVSIVKYVREVKRK